MADRLEISGVPCFVWSRDPVPELAAALKRQRKTHLVSRMSTIASDLPYLLDWSASTGAVVICPEYALLPEHTFPVALEEIIEVYEALMNRVDLGFEVNRIVVTGESAGGNLATSLCVQLDLQQ